MVTVDATRALARLDSYVSQRDYAGPDPYDGLRAPLARVARSRRPRQAIVQLVKRSPVNLRQPLRIPPVRMSKALALFRSGLLQSPWLPDAQTRAQRLAEQLAESRTDGAWGYEFDVQTRWGFYPAGSPNIIATAFVVEALNDAKQLLRDNAAGAWLAGHMVHPDGFIRYVPGNDNLIHNANLLGARALHRLQPGHPAIASAVEASLRAQLADGLWRYGEAPGLEWIDNFHTAYVLLALGDLAATHPDVASALERGIEAWASRCFADDGRPRYYADRDGATDVHNVATSVYALSQFADSSPSCRHLLPGALAALLSLQRPDGAFVAHRREPPYMRWNQGHAFLALSTVANRTPVATTGNSG